MAMFTGAFTRRGSATRFGLSRNRVDPNGLAWDGDTLFLNLTRADQLHSLNRTTGIATRIGSARFAERSIAWDGTNLYAVFDYLTTVNRRTAEVTRVGSATTYGLRNFDTITSLAWDGTNLYTAIFTTDNVWALYTINRTTGVATRVGSSDNFGVSITSVWDMTWDGEQLLMVARASGGGGTRGEALFSIDRTTGAATRIGNVADFGVSGESLRGLAWDGSQLFATGTINDALYVATQIAPTPTTPDTPTGLTLTVVDHDTLRASWRAVSDATYYEVKIATSEVALGAASWQRVASGTSFDFDGLSPSTEYFSVVRSGNDTGTSDPTSAVSATTRAAPPIVQRPTFTAPTGQQVNEGGSWSLDLASVFRGATSYDFQSGYSRPSYLTLTGSVLRVARAPGVSSDTTINILVQGTNTAGTTPGTVQLMIRDVPAPPIIPPVTIEPSTPIESITAFNVEIDGVDVSNDVETIRDMNGSADYPIVSRYRIREVTITLIDPTGKYATRNEDGLARVGSPIRIQVDGDIVFTGEIIEMPQGLVGASVTLICSGASWALGRDTVTDFGVRRRFRLVQETEQQLRIALGQGRARANGVYPVLKAALPASRESASGFGRALNDPLTAVENLRSQGLLDYHRFATTDDSVETEGEPVPNPPASFPQVIFKSPYRHQRALTMVAEILDKFEISNRTMHIYPSNIGEHFAQLGRVNYDLIGNTGDRFDVPLAWGNFVTYMLADGIDRYYLLSIPQNDNGFYVSQIIKYDGNDDANTEVYRFPTRRAAWRMAKAGNVFYVLQCDSQQSPNARFTNSDVSILRIDTSNNSVSTIANSGSTYPPQLAKTFYSGASHGIFYPESRGGFEVYGGKLYYPYFDRGNNRGGIARYPDGDSVMSYAWDQNENDAGLAFSINAAGLLTGAIEFRDGVDSDAKVFSRDLS